MGDPLGALTFAKNSLKENGYRMIVEPMSNDNLEDNPNIVDKIYYAASSVICVPNSLADKGIALGAQAGEGKIRDIALNAGFMSFRRASQTPFNVNYEAK